MHGLLTIGNNDLVVPHISTENWMSTLNLTVDEDWRACHDLLVGEKGGITMCEPDPIVNVVRALFGEETVMDSNSLCSENDGLDQYSVCHKPDDGVEVSSTKGRKWKRMARSQGSKAGGGHNSSLKRKRKLCFDSKDGQQIKKGRTKVNMSDTAAVAGNLMALF
ncbi:hypothetical protein ACOSQ4_007800 [Xanthoceras sorbifolium]